MVGTVNLGDVSFGLGADTKGMRDAIRAIQNFQKIVDRTAASQEKGAATAAAALGRQEQALRRAAQQAINLQTAMRQSGAPAGQIANTTNALRSLIAQLTKGHVSSIQFSRAIDSFNARLASTRGAFNRFRKDTKASQKETFDFTKLVRDLESASVLAVGPLSGLGARIRAIGSVTGRSGIAIAAMIGAISGLTVAVIGLGRGAIRAASDLERFNSRLVAVTGSSVAAAREFEFISSTADKLGLDLRSTAEQYSRLAGAAANTVLEGELTRRIFLGVAKAGAAMRLTTEEITGAVRALSQIMSKGTVQAEELRGQLGERILGAFNRAAEAMGVTTAALGEMLKKGELTATEFLPRFADALDKAFGKRALDNAESLTGTTNRLSNAFFRLQLSINQTLGLSRAYRSVLEGLVGVLNFLQRNVDNLTAGFFALGVAITTAFAPTVIGLVRGFTRAIIALGAAMLAIPGAPLVALLGRIVAALGAGTIAFFAFRNSMRETERASELLQDALEASNSVLDDARKSSLSAAEARRELALQTLEAARTAVILADKERQAHLERLRIAAESEAIGLPGIELRPGAEAAIRRIEAESLATADAIAEIDRRIREVKTAPLSTIADAAGDASKEFGKAKDKVDELIRSYETLKAATEAASLGEEAVKDIIALGEAIEMLRDVPDAELGKLKRVLEEAGFSADTVEEALRDLIRAEEALDEKTKELLDTFEKLPEVLSDATEELERIREEIEAMAAGPDAFEEFEKLRDIEDDVRALEEALRKVGASEAIIAEETEKLRKELLRLKDAREVFEDLEEIVDTVEKGFGKAFETAVDGLIKFSREGKSALGSFRDFALDVLGDIQKALFEIFLIEPFKAGVRSFASSAFAPFAGAPSAAATTPGTTGGGSFFDSILGFLGLGGRALGGDFAAGEMIKVGERGTELVSFSRAGTVIPSSEAPSRGAGKTIVNIVTPPGATAETSTHTSGGNEVIDIRIIDKMVGQAILGRGEAHKAIVTATTARPAVKGR